MDLIQSKIVVGNVCELEELLQQISHTESAPPAVLLSHAYAELTHHNVPLSAEVVHFIESVLIKASYQRAAAYQPNDSAAKSEPTNRVLHLVKSIDLIVNHHRTGLYTDIDESMIQRLRHVYAHVFFLKTHHRKLPLLQLQFCIAVFLKLVTGKANNSFDVFSFAIDKERLIRFLQLVRNELVSSQHSRTISFERYYQYIGYLLKADGRSKASLRVPKRIRTFIRADFRVMQPLFSGIDCKMSFTELPSQLQKGLKAHYDKTVDWDARRRYKKYFKELNDTYFLMKQHYSIRKILSYIDGVPEVTPNTPPSPTIVRAIKRSIQVIGETIKSTRETPNITVKLNRVLKLITSVALTERTKDLRQFFSHGYPLSKWELERSTPADVATVFQTIGKNLREARHWFVYTQTQQNLRLYRHYLAYLLAFDSMDALRSYIAFVGTEFKASLIQSFLPEQLTEAKLLLQEMLRTSSKDSDPAYTATLRPDLEYLEREIELRINAIRNENASLGRTVDEYFFLETYIRQPSGTLDRVRTIVRSVLCATELSNRHKLVEKTDLRFGRELMARLHTMERDEGRANLWHSIWQRLARDNFDGIDTLMGRTEQRSDVVLDETVRTMQSLGLPLADEEFVQFVDRRFVKSYYPNVFVLDNKYRVLKEIIKDRRAQVGVRDALAKLKELRRSDEAVLQGMYDQLIDRMGETLHNASGTRADQIALEYSLLEVSEILCNLGLFRDNVADLAASMTPVVTGRNLRNYLAHDSLAYDTLMAGSPVPGATIVHNAQFLVEHRTRLYHVPSVSGPHSAKGEQLHFEEVYKLQTEWTAQQVEFLERVKQMDLVQQFAGGARADLLLPRRDHLDYDIVSIALNAHPAKFISQLVCYEESEANFFHFLLSHDCMGDVKGMIRSLIENPHLFCLRLALMNGLWEETEASFRHCRDEPEVQPIVTREVPCLFRRHSTPFIVRVLELFPSVWFHGVADHLGNTILHLAVLRGDKNLLLLVLRRYGNLVNVANKFGDVPLLIAVLYSDDTAIADLLFEHGANPWSAPNILAKVASCNRLSLLLRVSDAFASRMPPVGDDLRNNPMRAALESGQFEVFQTLHRTFRYDLHQGELLHLASRLNRFEFLRYILLEVKDVDPVNAGHCFTPLMVACGSGHYESAQLLLQHGASGVFRNENGYSPWHCAVYSGRKRVVRLLLAMCPGVDVNTITRDKHSALGLAIEAGHSVPQMLVLLRAGVSVSADHVLQACTGDRFVIFKLLLERHPEFLEARDYFQRTPLMLAVIEGNVAMVRYLLACGANVNTVNMLGMGCLHVTAMNNQVQICTILLEAPIDCEAEDRCCRTPLVVALECEHLTMVEMLLRHGVQLESAYRFRYGVRHRNASLLHKFTIEKRPRMVQYLLQNLRFPPDTKDDDGKTAAMYESEE
ncbi:uncharacterized protein LOC131215376 [Anopheles bellator]|uniref:uncharacterized protein LOC131215376 n=1 Tax=Anopheles bellator TaxID=139047 RepID=UPI002649F8C7|nr:uncharacterized protein LOC131215376 [Anopheles bellator]